MYTKALTSVTAVFIIQQFISILTCVKTESDQSGSPMFYFSLEQRLPISSDMINDVAVLFQM